MSMLAKLHPSTHPLDLLEAFAESLAAAASDRGPPMIGEWVRPTLPNVLALAPDASPEFVADRALEALGSHNGRRLLDFGCGEAPHRGLLTWRGFDWCGVDYDGSDDPAALSRDTSKHDVALYRGTALPFPDRHFDCVWSYQSFEHLPCPEESMAEVSRVLVDGGIFAGSVSFLEPFHARSCFGFSLYGWVALCNRHGLEPVALYPRNDGLSLIFRSYLQMMGFDGSETDWDRLMGGGGIFYRALAQRAEKSGMTAQLADALAEFCGHFCFIMQRLP